MSAPTGTPASAATPATESTAGSPGNVSSTENSIPSGADVPNETNLTSASLKCRRDGSELSYSSAKRMNSSGCSLPSATRQQRPDVPRDVAQTEQHEGSVDDVVHGVVARRHPLGQEEECIQRQQHTTSLAVADAYPLGFELLFDPGGVAAGAGGVDHHHHFGVTAVVNDQVVADATGFIQQHRVLGFAGANALQIAGHQPLEFVFDA